MPSSQAHAGLYPFLVEEGLDAAADMRLTFWTDANGDGTGGPDTELTNLRMTNQTNPSSPGVSFSETSGTITGSLDSHPTTKEYDGAQGSPVTVWWMLIEYNIAGAYHEIAHAKHDDGGVEIKTNQQFQLDNTTAIIYSGSSDNLAPDSSTNLFTDSEPASGWYTNPGVMEIIYNALVNEDGTVDEGNNSYDVVRVTYETNNNNPFSFDISITSGGWVINTAEGDPEGMIEINGSQTYTISQGDPQDGDVITAVEFALYDTSGTSDTVKRPFVYDTQPADKDGNTGSSDLTINAPVDVSVNAMRFVL